MSDALLSLSSLLLSMFNTLLSLTLFFLPIDDRLQIRSVLGMRHNPCCMDYISLPGPTTTDPLPIRICTGTTGLSPFHHQQWSGRQSEEWNGKASRDLVFGRLCHDNFLQQCRSASTHECVTRCSRRLGRQRLYLRTRTCV